MNHQFSERGSLADTCKVCKTEFSIAVVYDSDTGGSCPGYDCKAYRNSAWYNFYKKYYPEKTDVEITKLAIIASR